MRPTRASRLVIGVAAMIFVIGTGAAQVDSAGTRTFEGTGSLEKTRATDLYLFQGTYHHRLVGTLDCYTTAGLFPARDDLGVPLADVLHGDLSVGHRSAGNTNPEPTGTLRISRPGWVRLEVGTGPDCPWTYSISGRLLAEGDEPKTESERSVWWIQIAAIAIVASLAVLALRRKSPKSSEHEETPIRLIDPTNDD